MKLLPFLLIFASPLLALDKEEILKIAAKPHSPEILIPELKIFPTKNRKYTVKEWMVTPDKEKLEGPAFITKEKVVEGRYIASEMDIPGLEDLVYMIVTYETDTETYKKWVLLPDGKVISSTGLGDMKTKTMAWVSDKPHGTPPTTVLGHEVHTKKNSQWKETILQDGKVVGIRKGVAIPSK